MEKKRVPKRTLVACGGKKDLHIREKGLALGWSRGA